MNTCEYSTLEFQDIIERPTQRIHGKVEGAEIQI
jgi:hypothetical protein